MLTGKPFVGNVYVLDLKNDFSRCVHLRPCKKVEAHYAATVLMESTNTIIQVLKWFSDQEPRFCNKSLELLGTTVGVRNNFSVAFAPY